MKKLSLFLTLSMLSLSLAFSNELEILTPIKQEISKLKKEQTKQKEQVNKYNWLSDISINASSSKDNENKRSDDYSLSFSQDIFRFGAIPSQMTYAKLFKQYEDLNIDIANRQDIIKVYTSLINIKLNEIALKQNILNLKNAQIDLEHKKSEYKEGQIGISDLNEVIISKNSLMQTQQDLKLEKQKNKNSLKQYTNKNILDINLPSFNLLSKKEFLQKANAIKKEDLNTKVNKLALKIKKSDYLPKLSANGKFGYKDANTIEGDDYYSYGLSFIIPLSYTSKNDIEQNKLEYLISKQNLQKQKNDLEVTYDEVLLILKNYEEKIKLALEDIKLYEELIFTNKQEYEAGYKTVDDVLSLENSKKIKLLDIESYKLNMQNQMAILYKNIL